jgi:hypothetical protein
MSLSASVAYNECVYSDGSNASVAQAKNFFDNITQFGHNDLTLKGSLFITLTSVSMITNISFIYIILRGLRNKTIPYQLHYFLLNRSLCDFAASSMSFIAMVGSVGEFLLPTIVILLMTDQILPYYSNAATCLFLAVLKLIAIKKPFFYKTSVTKKGCLCVIAVSWLIGMTCQAIFSTMILHVLGYGATFMCATVAECVNSAKFFVLILSEISYISVLVVFAITAYFVRRSQANSKKSLWKLAVIVSVFAVFNCLEGPGEYFMLQNIPYQISMFYSPTVGEKCVILDEEEFKNLRQQMYFVLVYLVFFICRMKADPLANFLIDKKLRYVLFNDLKRCVPKGERNSDCALANFK